MPNYFPENNIAKPEDTEVRSLQKINDLLAGGSSVINVDIAGSVTVSNLPSLTAANAFKGAANSVSGAATALIVSDASNRLLVDASQTGTWNFNLPSGASTSVLQITGNNSLSSIDSKIPNQTGGGLTVANTSVSVIEPCTSLTNWTTVQTGTGDIVQLDGNACAASFITISKDPFTENTETILQHTSTFKPPYVASIAASCSQTAVGQEEFLEYVSTESPVASYTPVAISAMSQSTTTLTVTTSSAHNLQVGSSISISGIPDSRFNYPALNVAFINSPTQFVCTSSPSGTIPSVTVSTINVGASPLVHLRPRLGYSQNGSSVVSDSASNSTMAFYSRGGFGEVQPANNIGTTQQGTSSDWSSTSLAAAGYAVNLASRVSFDCLHEPASFSWFDKTSDSNTSAENSRAKFDRVVPDPSKTYRFRVRAVNNPSMTRPVAKIVSASKSGSTTATINTDVAHGLTTSDFVSIYGVRNQTDFPNTATVAVSSIVSTTSFTVVLGTTVPTVTSYGGYVSRVKGGTAQPGARLEVGQSASRTNNIVTVVTNQTTNSWTTTYGTSAVIVGDYVNLVGFYNTSGVSLGIDGSYRVLNPIASNGSLVLEPIGSAPTGADFGSTLCGGGIIKRSDIRIHGLRVKELKQLSVETNGTGFARFDRSTSVGVSPVVDFPAIAAPSTGYGHVSRSQAYLPAVVGPATGSGVVGLRSGSVNFGMLTFSNAHPTAKRWVKMHNVASSTSVTPGTTVAEVDLLLPPNSTVTLPLGWAGARFTTGLYVYASDSPGLVSYPITSFSGLSNAMEASSVVAAAVVAGGAGYSSGDILTVTGGTGTAAVLRASTVTSGVITAATVVYAGNYTAWPTNPVSVTGGTGNSATFNLTFSDVSAFSSYI